MDTNAHEDYDDHTGLRKGLTQRELLEHPNCTHCGRKLGQCNSIFSWRVTLEQHGINLPALQRQHGLAMFLGSGKLAQIMGGDEDATKRIDDPLTLHVCGECATKPAVLMILHATESDRVAARERDAQPSSSSL